MVEEQRPLRQDQPDAHYEVAEPQKMKAGEWHGKCPGGAVNAQGLLESG